MTENFSFFFLANNVTESQKLVCCNEYCLNDHRSELKHGLTMTCSQSSSQVGDDIFIKSNNGDDGDYI